MFDEQWQFAVEVERKYAKYRKKVMVRYDLSAAEVDVLLFLANNSLWPPSYCWRVTVSTRGMT